MGRGARATRAAAMRRFAALLALGPSGARRGARRARATDAGKCAAGACTGCFRFAAPEDAGRTSPRSCTIRARRVRHAALMVLTRSPGARAAPTWCRTCWSARCEDESLRVRRQAVLFLAWEHPHPGPRRASSRTCSRSEHDPTLRKYAGMGLVRCRAASRRMLSTARLQEFEMRGVVRLARRRSNRQLAEWLSRAPARVRRRAEARADAAAVSISPSIPRSRRRSRSAAGSPSCGGRRCSARSTSLLGARAAGTCPRHAGQILALLWPQPDAALARAGQDLAPRLRSAGRGRRICRELSSFLCLDRVESRWRRDAGRRRACRAWSTLSAGQRNRVGRAAQPRCGRQSSARCPGSASSTHAAHGTRTGSRASWRSRHRSTGSLLPFVELTGEPGDVWLMHPWMLHAPSANCSARPRMVLTERIRAA